MTVIDFNAAKDWLTIRYGNLGPAWVRSDDLYPDFGHFTAGSLREACSDWYRRGEKFPPKPAELLTLTGSVARTRQERGEDPPAPRSCGGRHTWALAGPSDRPRVDICAVCHTERPSKPCRHVPGPNGCVYCSEPLNGLVRSES